MAIFEHQREFIRTLTPAEDLEKMDRIRAKQRAALKSNWVSKMMYGSMKEQREVDQIIFGELDVLTEPLTVLNHYMQPQVAK